jgi:hypothetical protein
MMMCVDKSKPAADALASILMAAPPSFSFQTDSSLKPVKKT